MLLWASPSDSKESVGGGHTRPGPPSLPSPATTPATLNVLVVMDGSNNTLATSSVF